MNIFKKKSFRVSNSLDRDKTRQFVGLDLGQNCMERSSADDSSRQFKELISSQSIYLYLSSNWGLSKAPILINP